MSDEFDEMLEPGAPNAHTAADDVAARAAIPNSRLVARLFAAAGNPLRISLLRCLMRPLGTLGAAGVAAGAFVGFLDRRGADAPIDAEAVSQVSSQQIYELAHFVEQVDPQALQQFVSLASSSSLAMATTFSAAALMLLYRRLHPVTRQTRSGHQPD
jgi:hypothetical protein